MEEINMKKQKINYEGKMLEGVNEYTVKGEYLIPDTHPDVNNVLMIDVKPRINSTEAFTDKIFVEGEIVYTIIYVAKDEDKNNTYNVSYSDKFNLYVETFGLKKENLYNVEVEVMNINSTLLNERKVGIEGVLKFKSTSNEVLELDLICDLEDQDDVQLLMKDMEFCEIKNNLVEEISSESILNVPMDKPAISKILACDSLIYKTECKLSENKVSFNAYCKVKVLYKGLGSDDICYFEQDIYLNKESDFEDVSPEMIGIDNWNLSQFEYMIDEDESGESRIINVFVNLNCDLKLINKTTVSVIDDAYSKNSLVNLVKNTYKMNFLECSNDLDIIVKDNIDSVESPLSVIYTDGTCILNNKKLVEGKVVADGVVKVNIIYKSSVNENEFLSVSKDIPFTTYFEDESIKIDMEALVKCNLESIDAFVEAKTIGVKAVVNVKMYVNSEVKKDILVDIYKTQEENTAKDSSVIIYIVGEEDTLWSIAKKYCVSVEDICRINDITQEENISGSKLLIPSKAIF